MNKAAVGVWCLAAAASFQSEAHSGGALDEWLYGSSHSLQDEAKPIQGLTLTIHADDTFTETKTSLLKLPWYDEEGVLGETVTPFSGVVKSEGDWMYLHLATPVSWATPADDVRKRRVRYDDGDTIICDKFELTDTSLVRTMNIVTDELYLDRLVLIYHRADEQVSG